MQTHIKVNNGWCYVIASVILVSLAQLCIKLGLNQWVPNAPYSAALLIITTGIICYAISFMTWIKALTYLPLSRAYPALALSYIAVYLVAVISPAFNEAFQPTGFLGVLLIAAGVILVTRK